MADGDSRMVEVEIGAVSHAEFFHNVARGPVAEGGDGDHFRKVEGAEAKVDDGACAFAGEALALRGACEAPADLDGRLRQVGDDVAHDLRADETYELAG